jgi:hypothetical protein
MEFQYTNIRRGETVWFVWTNMGGSANEEYLQIYNHMLRSLRFGPRSPLNLRDISLSKFQNEPSKLPETGIKQTGFEFVYWMGVGSTLLLVGSILKLLRKF